MLGYASANVAVFVGVAAGAVSLTSTINEAVTDRQQYRELASYWDGQVEMASMISDNNIQLGVGYGKLFAAGGCAEYYQNLMKAKIESKKDEVQVNLYYGDFFGYGFFFFLLFFGAPLATNERYYHESPKVNFLRFQCF